MSKSSKSKKTKVPKITEEEYAAYVSALRELTEGGSVVAQNGVNGLEKKETE